MVDFSSNLIPTNAKNTAVSTPADDFHPDGGFWRQQYNNFLSAAQNTITALQDSLTALSVTVSNLSIEVNTKTNYSTSSFDVDFAAKTTDDLEEGATKKYYSTSQAQTDARTAISVTGSLSYNSATGQLVGTATNGTDGKSAYQIWLDQGNTGTINDFFASLKGDPGLNINRRGIWNSADTYQIADAVTYNGSSYIAIAINQNSTPALAPQDWELWVSKGDPGVGSAGLSAYQIWLAQGNSGSEADYVNATLFRTLTKTQAEYNALTPVVGIFYLIVG